MYPEGRQNKEQRTLRQHFAASLAKRNRNRPASFYLIFAILAVVLLGSQVVYIKDDPKRFAFFLSLNFVFFLVVVYRALIDSVEILRGHFKERNDLYRATLGDEEFTTKLGRSVAKNSDD